MKDARQLCEDAAAEADARTLVPADLQLGDGFQKRVFIMKQCPKLFVLGCLGLRVPMELVFDQGLSGIFAIRIEGNGLLEYAAHHFMVKIMGAMEHECCGAVKVTLAPVFDSGPPYHRCLNFSRDQEGSTARRL